MVARCAAPLLALVFSALSLSVFATGVVTVSQPWVRPAASHANTPAYLVLGSSEPLTLVGARSDAGPVSLVRGKARVDSFALTAGVPLLLAPNGPHLELRSVTRALVRGQRVALTLVLRDVSGATREIDVNAEVRLRSPIDDERHAHGAHAAH